MDVLHFLQIKFSGGMNHEYCIFTGFFCVLNFVKLCRTFLNNAFFSAILRKKYSKCLLFFKKTVLNFPYMKQNA